MKIFAGFDKEAEERESLGKKRDGRNLILVDRPESKLVWPTQTNLRMVLKSPRDKLLKIALASLRRGGSHAGSQS